MAKEEGRNGINEAFPFERWCMENKRNKEQSKNCFDTLNYYLHRKRYKTVGYVEVATK